MTKGVGKKNLRILTIGILVTVLYCFGLYFIFDVRICDLKALKLNELGDFLAGSFGPLALFWLILGFIQQGFELKQNTDALRLQAEELQNSVVQQRELVKVTEKQFKASLDQLNHEREMQRKTQIPIIVHFGTGKTRSGGVTIYNIRFRNVGKTATKILFSVDQIVERLHPSEFTTWESGGKIETAMTFPNSLVHDCTILTISYIDSVGIPGIVKYDITQDPDPNRSGIKITEKAS